MTVEHVPPWLRHTFSARHAECRAKDAIAEWIEAEVPDAGRVTNISGRGSSGWASSSRYETDSGMSFFVKQVGRAGMELLMIDAGVYRRCMPVHTSVRPAGRTVAAAGKGP